jgi:hypothetical protein
MTVNEFHHGVPGEVLFRRIDRRWQIIIFSSLWMENDIRAELSDGTAFIIDPENTRTNGIVLSQVERGD